jgi:hypothetical protein
MESKERPILFSGPMVRAILDGKKTQTRRVVKPTAHQKRYVKKTWDKEPSITEWNDMAGLAADINNGQYDFKGCPYGSPGDRLWVRETFADLRPHKERARKIVEQWPFGKAEIVESEYDDIDFIYKADWDAQGKEYVNSWTPSIHMPRVASRINLEIIAIGVERVQDISGKDADAEGIKSVVVDGDITDFAFLWDEINGKKHPWKDNPWVWVVEFKKL